MSILGLSNLIRFEVKPKSLETYLGSGARLDAHVFADDIQHNFISPSSDGHQTGITPQSRDDDLISVPHTYERRDY